MFLIFLQRVKLVFGIYVLPPVDKVNFFLTKPLGAGLGQVLSGLGNLMASVNQQGKNDGTGGVDLSMLGPLMQLVASASSGANQRSKRSNERETGAPAFDFESMMSMASMFMGGKSNNMDGIMGLVPMILENFNNGGSSSEKSKSHDHSSHAWFMPPILENLHVMWDHFR